MSIFASLRQKISLLWTRLKTVSLDRAFRDIEEPIRSEIFSEARLQTHAQSLAEAQKITDNPRRSRPLSPRIRENRRILERSYIELLKAVDNKRAITPAAEWIVDNFHIIRALLKDIQDHLPPNYYRELPKLATGPLAGYPRVYGIAWAFLAHTDSRFDAHQLKVFLQAYQKVAPLTIGELWAVPITLRIVIIENLRRLSTRIVASQRSRQIADTIADEVLDLAQYPSRKISRIIDSLEQEPFLRGFVVQLLQRLRFQESKAEPILQWLEKRLTASNLTSDDIITVEHNSQTAANATARNIITSSRLMGAFNWQDFFEDVSLVDGILKEDLSYTELDFITRNRFRNAIEELARCSPQSEIQIARLVFNKVEEAEALPLRDDPRIRELGYYLISSGRYLIEKKIGFKSPLKLRWIRLYTRFGIQFYLFGILALTLSLISIPLVSISHSLIDSLAWPVALVLLSIFPASEIAVAIINRMTVATLGPRHLPRFSLRRGVPPTMRTFVVVPTLLTKIENVESQIKALEIHYLSNPEENLFFALLTDGIDAATENTFLDNRLLELAQKEISKLNAKYPQATHLEGNKKSEDRFYVFHRRRIYNPNEGRWMGWERKRGKLHEFNRLLLGATDTSYIPLNGEPLQVPSNIRFVITLDSDTRMPNGCAVQLIGTMGHPLNQARWDEKLQRVIGGYGILQPRITPMLPSMNESTTFQKLSTGKAGIDPYASAVSDVYQDLFGEGSYAGKGIYEVAVFEKSLAGRIPENSLLSHDLFEGNRARCGFLSDVDFFEEFPGQTEVAHARNHRWIRGDWQLLPWILGRQAKAISTLGHWKMLDNLRRSLVAPMNFLLINLALLAPRIAPAPWLLLALLSLGIPTLVTFAVEIFSVRPREAYAQHLRQVMSDLMAGFSQFFLSLTLLAKHSWLHLDAVIRALYRMLVSHKKMLEWTTAAQVSASARLNWAFFVKNYRGALFLSLISAVAIVTFHPSAWLESLPFLILWFSAPVIARQMSLPPTPKLIRPLLAKDIQYLRCLGRRIWYFFATFTTEEDHFLPPDNFQETPDPVVAHRSSPTNFGLYLLSVISARDFGWIGTAEMAKRLNDTLKSLSVLPRHQGHFYNWYETREARALDPKYISSVDNGNLAGHLLAVAQGCLEVLEHPIPFYNFREGVLDSILVLEENLEMFPTDPYLMSLLGDIKTTLTTTDRQHLIPYSKWLELQSQIDKISSIEQIPKVKAWLDIFLDNVRSVQHDFHFLFPWLHTVNAPHSFSATGDLLWDEICERLTMRLSLKDSVTHFEALSYEFSEIRQRNQIQDAAFIERLDTLIEALSKSVTNIKNLNKMLTEIHDLSLRLFHEMDFRLLYDPIRKLFSIGYRVADEQLDSSYYDLLASEARLTSYVAIAKGDVPASHWFQLGRGLTNIKNGLALISWSGSMFEFLMPSLVMKAPEGSLLEQTCRLAVQRQIEYGSEKNVPWGLSESAYNKRDIHLTYQYSNFGVPDLGLKRGLGSNIVVAPYATILAAMYESYEAILNLHRLEKLGAKGEFGFYEAVDFTPPRVPKGEVAAVVKAYMAHHQGMSLVAINNVFKNGLMRERFHSEPMVQATELLLQERMPRNTTVSKPERERHRIDLVREEVEHVSRQYHTVNRPVPTTHLLSNGDYSVMLTSAGSGYSRFRDISITRWREDVTRDDWGYYFFLRDIDSGDVWSAGYQPTCVEPDHYEVTFFEDRARYHREDKGIVSELEIFVSPEDQAEVRRLTLTNNSDQERELEVTSYAEIVLNTHSADVAHPAFSNLFVQTEFDPNLNALIATRRPRSSHDRTPWLAQILQTDAHAFGPIEYETNRQKFLGRGRTVRRPEAIYDLRKLSNTVGAVLDPIFSLKAKVRLRPGASTHLTFSTVLGFSREEVTGLADKFLAPTIYERVAGLAWTQGQVKLHFFNLEPDEAHLFQRLATRMIYLDSSLRPSTEIIKKNKKDVTGLWAHGISGDEPIVLVRIDDFEDRGIIRQLLKAHDYLAYKGLSFDLVILNDQGTSYAQDLQNSLQSLIHNRAVLPGSQAAPRGKVFVLMASQLSEEDRILLLSSARAVLSSRQGNLSEQVKRSRMIVDKYSFPSDKSPAFQETGSTSLPNPPMTFFNGLGGFSENGHEYIIILKKTDMTPSPWINVISNSRFGFQVSESGSGYTWAYNSRENQITPWNNDPVSDPSGEAFYILDRDSGALWSPTALPIRVSDATYLVHHGAGFSRFEHLSHDIYTELTQFVAKDEPAKISRLVIENRSRHRRRLSICAYVEWVLGFSRATMAPTTVTELDASTGAIFAYNRRSNEYGGHISFAVFKEGCQSWTGDRSEFLGRNGSMAAPGGMYRENGFSNRVGASFDACSALRKDLELGPGEKVQLNFYLGQTENREMARDLIKVLKNKSSDFYLSQVKDFWSEVLNKVQVQTPDASMNLMLNRWLLYQTLACRFWARAGFYQAGGAFGFRDQLQDVMALTAAQPNLARSHILRAASRQFVEGDVQHWWHPPLGRGVRTHFSDDLLWLPFTVSYYLKTTQDFSILDEEVSFLEGPALRPDQEDSYYTPTISHNSSSLYNHCVRALDHSLRTGAHGLPLMGSGDWNDGMNRVGYKGQGESVWLAWFLHTNLLQFSEIADARSDNENAKNWRDHATRLRSALDKSAWDGQWYLRAFFDDGTPLGSASQEECQIDSLSQTWAVISGAADKDRARMALRAVEKYLIRPKDRMILLFTPPFDKTPLDPGYIKGYLPGVRENGGQYTHAATWCIIAYAMLNEGRKATELFSMLNPISHASTPVEMEKYKVEPYVLAADVYGHDPYIGRGGWTWYTGSCGWMYRAGIEYILGLQIIGNEILLKPCIPPSWKDFKIVYRHGLQTYYDIIVENPLAQPEVIEQVNLDGELIAATGRIPLIDDGQRHMVLVTLGRDKTTTPIELQIP
jgi:cyclic beta-1,2-glucan synthetase